MSDFHHWQIKKPKWYKGVRPISRGFPKQPIINIGLDTESVRGKPYSYQISGPDGDDFVYWHDPKDTLIPFIDIIKALPRKHRVKYLVWVHNLEYEFTQIFRNPEVKQSVWLASEINWENPEGTIHIRLFNGSLKAGFISFGKRNAKTGKFEGRSSVWLVDTFAFFKTNLDAAAKQCGITLPKLPKPEGLGEKKLTGPDFERYAIRDAVLARMIGESIVERCRDWNLPIPISAPQMSGYLFRKHYLRETIDPIPPDCEELALSSYHGGKNGYYLNRPVEVDCYQADIRSAYPYAFTQIPEPEKAVLLYSDSHIEGGHGICKIEADINPCEYGILQESSGRYIRGGGRVETVCTSYEYESARDRGEIKKVHRYRGYYLVPIRPQTSLNRYAVDLFQRRKTDPPNESYYKLMLNSLYGKFIQKTPLETEPTIGPDKRFRCGALYHPLLASLITGYIRALLHGFEHDYGVIMTSTDGFFCREQPEAGDGLGTFKVVTGRLKVFRGRLYTFRVEGRIVSWAGHGFRGSRDQLDRLSVFTHEYRYRAKQVITNKIAARTEAGAGEFVEREYVLNIRPPP